MNRDYPEAPGVWVIYSRESIDIFVHSIHSKPTRAIESLGSSGFMIAYVPFDKSLEEGVCEWEDKTHV